MGYATLLRGALRFDWLASIFRDGRPTESADRFAFGG